MAGDLKNSNLKKHHDAVKVRVKEQIAHTSDNVKEKISHPLVNKLIIISIILFALWELLLYLHNTSYISIPDVFLASSKSILIILSILAVTSIVVRFTVNSIFKLFEGDVDVEYRIFLSKFYVFMLYAFAVVLILYLLNIGMTFEQFTLIITLLTTGIAFAIRDIVFSYFVWAILLTKKPFRIGDIVAFGDDIGRVQRIGTFFVTLSQTDGSIIKAPNKMLLDKNFVVHGEMLKDLVILRLTEPPKDSEGGFKASKQAINSIIGQEPSINLRTRDDSLHMAIEYPVTLENRFGARSAVIAKLCELHKDIIAFKKI